MATVKQKLAVKKVLNGIPIAQAMREVGYSKKTAANTTKLTQSKAFHEMLDEIISDEKLLKVHDDGLTAFRVLFTPEGEQITIPDFGVRHKYLQTGYELKNKIKSGSEGNKTLIINITGETAKRYGITPGASNSSS